MNGNEEGLHISYHNNGKTDSKGEYRNGKENGSWVSYHANGRLESKVNWENGNADVQVSYNEDGVKLDLEYYKNIKSDGWI